MKMFLLFVFAHTIFADDVIIITADRIKSDLLKSANNVEVINTETIAQTHAQNLPDLLRSSSDIQTSNGSIFLRGTDSAHTLVVLDGVVMNDPTNPNRSFDISKISLNNIEKVEVLKGAQSLLYGANAIGGVIVITSKKNSKDKLSGSGTASYETYQTYNLGIEAQSSSEINKISFGADIFKTQGFSAANSKQNPNAEPDGEKRSALNLNYTADINSHSSLDFGGRFIHDRSDLDSCGGAGCDDPTNTLTSENIFSHIQYNKIWNSEIFETHVFYNRAKFFHLNNSATFSSLNKGEINTLGANQTNYLSENLTQNINIEYAKETNQLKQYNENTNVFIYHKYETGNYIYNFGARVDHNKIFNDHVTYKVAAADKLNDEQLVRLSFSTGFQAPGLFQLLDSTYGNAGLKPEKSTSIELGHEWNKKSNQLHTSFFMTRIEDRFTYIDALKKTINSGTTVFNGIEETLKTSLSNTSVTWLSNWQTRRPHLLIKNTFFYQDFSFESEYVGRRPDVDKNSNTVIAPSYFISHLNYSYNNLFIKIRNIFNTEYEEAYGYGTGGRMVTIGLSKKF